MIISFIVHLYSHKKYIFCKSHHEKRNCSSMKKNCNWFLLFHEKELQKDFFWRHAQLWFISPLHFRIILTSISVNIVSVIFRFILNIVWCVFYFNCLIFSLSFSFLPRYIKVFHTIHKYLLIFNIKLLCRYIKEKKIS